MQRIQVIWDDKTAVVESVFLCVFVVQLFGDEAADIWSAHWCVQLGGFFCFFIDRELRKKPLPFSEGPSDWLSIPAENARTGALMPCNILSQRFWALDLWRSLLDIWLGCRFEKDKQKKNCSFLTGVIDSVGFCLGASCRWMNAWKMTFFTGPSGGGRRDIRSGTPKLGWDELIQLFAEIPGISWGKLKLPKFHWA